MGDLNPLLAQLASKNPGKARELEALLPGFHVVPLGDVEYPPEHGASYYENALGKARFGRATGRPEAWLLGEDSGLEVQGLGGGPGIESARFGGEDPVGRMLAALAGMDGEARRARYVCELVCISPDGRELRGSGTLEGSIAHEPRGSEGFGYDPLFLPDGEQRTVAELGNAWKSSHSHRASAARALLEALAG
ncbi:MAG: non-canonical purine NTP pyrophosphatase [Gaiellaceae bacterium]